MSRNVYHHHYHHNSDDCSAGPLVALVAILITIFRFFVWGILFWVMIFSVGLVGAILTGVIAELIIYGVMDLVARIS